MTPLGKGDGATHDTLLDGRVQLLQPRSGYRVAVDPVLLAAAVSAQPGARILDAGCGTGAALFCLLSRLTDVRGVGLDQDPEAVQYAQQNVDLNELTGRAEIVAGDLAQPPAVCASHFDVVISNPPFFEAGTVPPHPRNASAHTLSGLSLKAWINACLKLLKPSGAFALIHRAERVSDIIQALQGCGATRIIPLWPKANQPATRVIVTTQKGRKSPTTLHPGVVLHSLDGHYTDAANAILRDGLAFETMT